MVVLIAIARNIPFSRSHTTSKSRWCIEKQNSKLNREPLDARSSTIHVENSEATAVEIHLSSSTLYNNNAKKLISLSFPVPARSPPHSHGLEAGEHLVCVLRLEHRVLRRHEAQPEADEGHQVSQGTLWLTLWGTPGWSWSTLAPPPSTGNTTAALCPPGTIARQRWSQNLFFLFSYFILNFQVILELGWAQPCDVWSTGAIIFELYQVTIISHFNNNKKTWKKPGGDY